jgi:hypothetical protein
MTSIKPLSGPPQVVSGLLFSLLPCSSGNGKLPLRRWYDGFDFCPRPALAFALRQAWVEQKIQWVMFSLALYELFCDSACAPVLL